MSEAPNDKDKGEDPILFQQYFKSVGPRTYAAQVKEARNGNHYLVLTEGKRDDKTGEVRKARLFIFSEDFAPFFKLLHETAVFIRENPVPDDVRKRRAAYWKKQQESPGSAPDRPAPMTPPKRAGNGKPVQRSAPAARRQ